MFLLLLYYYCIIVSVNSYSRSIIFSRDIIQQLLNGKKSHFLLKKQSNYAELLTLMEHMNSPRFIGFVLINLLFFCVVFVCFHLTMVLCVLLHITASDYHLGIFKPFSYIIFFFILYYYSIIVSVNSYSRSIIF
jgi:hypothetical protein